MKLHKLLMLEKECSSSFHGKTIRRAIRVCQDFFYDYFLNEKHHPSPKNVLHLKRFSYFTSPTPPKKRKNKSLKTLSIFLKAKRGQIGLPNAIQKEKMNPTFYYLNPTIYFLGLYVLCTLPPPPPPPLPVWTGPIVSYCPANYGINWLTAARVWEHGVGGGGDKEGPGTTGPRQGD